MHYDTIIVGSGVAGLMAAYRLAPDQDVLVIDRAGIGEGTSSRASGVITTAVDYPDFPQWSAHALEFFRELDGTGTFEWTPREYVRGIRPENVEESTAYAEVEGVELLDAVEFDHIFADEAPYSHALVWENCGFFDVDDFIATMHNQATERGVEFRPDTTVESVVIQNNSAVGVETEYGAVEADNVVVAAGSATRTLLDDVLPLPMMKFTWNVAYLDAGIADTYPMGGDTEVGAYWRGTRDGYLLVGVEQSIDKDSTEEADQPIGETLPRVLSSQLPDLLAAVDQNTNVVRYEVCPMADSTTPDATPIIDAPEGGPDDLVVAAGFHGAGVMAAASIGTAVRAHILDEEAPFDLDPFRLDRFETPGTDFEITSMFSNL